MTSQITYEPQFQYNLDYFSGAQAQIYIGGILLDEITTLQWNEHQSKVPLYGYASQYFDEVARGAVLVQGQFSINFIQPNYLYSVLRAVNLKTEKGHASSKQEAVKEKLRNIVLEHTEPTNPADSNLWETVKEIDKRTQSGRFFKLMNDTIWGTSRRAKRQTMAGRADRFDVNGFDIKVNFQLEASGRPQCTQTIENVHILGSSKALVIDEQPVQEVYSFYARKIENA